MSVEDKQPYINHARDIYELLTRLPHDVEERAHDLALHHARQIVSFYEHFDLSDADALVYRDACAAENRRFAFHGGVRLSRSVQLGRPA